MAQRHKKGPSRRKVQLNLIKVKIIQQLQERLGILHGVSG